MPWRRSCLPTSGSGIASASLCRRAADNSPNRGAQQDGFEHRCLAVEGDAVRSAGSGPEAGPVRSRHYTVRRRSTVWSRPQERREAGERSMMGRRSQLDRTTWTRGIRTTAESKHGALIHSQRRSRCIADLPGRSGRTLEDWLFCQDPGSFLGGDRLPDEVASLIGTIPRYKSEKPESLMAMHESCRAGRPAPLRFAGHPVWSRNRRCTNILLAPVDGGRSGHQRRIDGGCPWVAFSFSAFWSACGMRLKLTMSPPSPR